MISILCKGRDSMQAFRGYWEDDRLKAAMCETFEELDNEFAATWPGNGAPNGPHQWL